MDLLGAKQEAIAANITNVNTPGYVRNDVNFEQYMGALRKPLETGLSKKMGPCPILEEKIEKVTIAQELIALQKNSLFYAVSARRASALIQEMKTIGQLGR
jgi:flagellar basal body rod protein FlgB